jgi:hypothetical protein
MTKAEALEIMAKGIKENPLCYTVCECDDVIVHIYPMDIVNNLECNGYELDLELIQDVNREDGDIFQGYSLSEMEVL